MMNSWVNGTFTVTCDPVQMDRALIADFLASTYWAKGIPAATVERSLAHSLCFALLDGDQQVGFARVISDYTTVAFLTGAAPPSRLVKMAANPFDPPPSPSRP